jgi:predicted dehydrogenase
MLRAGLVGCGWRGTQAAIEFLTGNENVELVTLGDLFPDKIQRTLAVARNRAKYPAIQN